MKHGVYVVLLSSKCNFCYFVFSPLSSLIVLSFVRNKLYITRRRSSLITLLRLSLVQIFKS